MARAFVGIDPSGRRLAVAAVRTGLGPPVPAAPPASFDLKGERDQPRLDEAETFLGDYVARNGLAGAAARLCIPAERLFTARVSFPRLKEKDLRAAVELELERLFPFPAARLRYGWRRPGDVPGGRGATLLVVAAEAAWLSAWEEAAGRAGLRLVSAIPAAGALAAALSAGAPGWGDPGKAAAVVRDAGGGPECTVYVSGEPVFAAFRPCPPEAAETEALALLEQGLVDAASSEDGAGVTLVAPSGWLEAESLPPGLDPPVRRGPDLDGLFGRIFGRRPGGDEGAPAAKVVCACGAAVGGRTVDLLAPPGEEAAMKAVRTASWAAGALAVVLALAWPAGVAWRTRAELARIDAEVAALSPAVAAVEKSFQDLAAADGRIAVLREAAAGRGEPLAILRILTDRLPQGTWLTALRIEERKTEIEGLSPSASEIFPVLTRDGRFRGVEFVSPVTRQADNLERFKIRAEYVPEGPPAPVKEGPAAAKGAPAPGRPAAAPARPAPAPAKPASSPAGGAR